MDTDSKSKEHNARPQSSRFWGNVKLSVFQFFDDHIHGALDGAQVFLNDLEGIAA